MSPIRFRPAAAIVLGAALAAALPGAALAAGLPAAATPDTAHPAAPAPAPPPSPSPFKPFQCPEGGPNGGHAPQAMAKSAGHTLVLCADTEAEEGRGLVATSAAIHEPDSAAPSKPIFSMVSDAVHLRVEAVPDRGFALTWESLLPRGTGEYQWHPVYASDVACGPDGCREGEPRCALDLPSAAKRDQLGRVRQLSRSGPIEPSVAQRLVDDLTVQALLGDDVAAWALEQLERILAVGPENRDALAQARLLLDRARASKCPALVYPPDEPPPPPPDPAAAAAEVKEQIARGRAGSRGTSKPSEPATPPGDLDSVAWLVGGRWDGTGTMPGGGTLRVEETYRWGPLRRSIRFQAQNAGAAAKSGSTVEGILFFEPKAGKIVLWNVKPGGGLSESAVTRADRSGCELVGADGRVRLARTGGDKQTRVVDQLQGGTWTTVVNATYERRLR